MTFTPAPGATPLWKKLGCRPERRVHLLAPPEGFAAWLLDRGFDVRVASGPDDVPEGADHVHLFTTSNDEAVATMRALAERIARDGQVWLSWPKRTSGVPHDIDKGLLHTADAFGDLVDVKVCAVDATWSGLKYVIRKERR